MGIVFCRLNRAVRALQPADAPRLLSQNRNQGRIEKTTAAAGQKLFFHLCPGSGAVPVIEIPKERRGKNKRGLNQREPPYGRAVFQKKTTADSCCWAESLLSSAKGIGGAGKNCKSTSSGQYRTDFDRLPPFYSGAKRGRPSDFGQYGHLKGLGLCQSHAFLSANSF